MVEQNALPENWVGQRLRVGSVVGYTANGKRGVGVIESLKPTRVKWIRSWVRSQWAQMPDAPQLQYLYALDRFSLPHDVRAELNEWDRANQSKMEI